MHTSFEQRLEFLQQFSDGLELFSENHPDAKIASGDGWRICSSKSQFAMFNNALLYTSRKEALAELIAIIEKPGGRRAQRLITKAVADLKEM